MNYRDVQLLIDKICEKYNLDSTFFIGGFTNTISKSGKLYCNFSQKEKYNYNKSRYGILYYLTDNIYIIWDFKAFYKDRPVKRCALKAIYSDIAYSIRNNKDYFTRYALFVGQNKENPICLKSVEELEQFIVENA